jgi:hypothetical protein
LVGFVPQESHELLGVSIQVGQAGTVAGVEGAGGILIKIMMPIVTISKTTKNSNSAIILSDDGQENH